MIAQLALLVSLCCGVIDEEKILINNLLQAKTSQCWTLDRLSNKEVVSCAATGVGFYGYARASQLNMITREEALIWIRTGFDNMLRVNAGNDGWLYHFISSRTGKPVLNSEISTIDSTIFYAGAEKAARLLGDHDLLEYIIALKGKIRLDIVRDSGGYISHGFTYGGNFIREYSPWSWKSYNEGVLIYKYFNIPFKPVRTNYDLPLFCYYYPLGFYPEEPLWIDNLGRAIDFQLENAGRFGYSAMDGEFTYGINSPFYVSPLAVTCTMKFFPLKASTQLKQFNCDRLTQSISVSGRWQSKDRVLLDDGFALLLLGNK